MRAVACDVTRKAIERTRSEPWRDTYVVNLKTGSAWFADGNEQVIPMKAVLGVEKDQ
jgi:hypothetical protein